MSGSFSVLRVASSGMYTSQAALNVTSSNISNSGVSAYTRQTVALADASTFSTVNGVDLADIEQIRDSYLDASYRKETGLSGYWGTLSGIASQLDSLGGYDSDTGLSTVAEEFFSAWEEASKAPEDAAVRSAVIEAGITLAETLNVLAEGLDAIRTQTETELEAAVETVNGLAEEASGLISQITIASAAGKDTATLEDQLNTTLDTLSEYGNVTVRQGENGKAVYFGNQLMVDNSTLRILAVERDTEGVTGVVWTASGNDINLSSGSLMAQLEVLAPADDGVSFGTGTTGLLEAYENTLVAYGDALVAAVNTAHGIGYDLNGNTGTAFFTAADDTQPIGIGNLQVNSVLDDTGYLVCSAGGESGDGDCALEIASLLDAELFTTVSGESVTASGFQSELAEWTGFIGDTAASNLETQEAVVAQISTERTAVTGVSLDEEMTRMIAYQQAYSANAQILSIMSELLDTVINDMKR